MEQQSNQEPVKVAEKTMTGWAALPTTELANVKIVPQLMREVMLALQANMHHSNANTKRRGEVRGGGKKPWRQKGTGRARVGSSRTPVWRGGGIVFGPLTTKNFGQNITIAARRQALGGALKLKLDKGQVWTMTVTEPAPKTKAIIQKFPQLLTADPILVVVNTGDNLLGLRNLSNLRLVNVARVNALDVASARQVVFVNNAFEAIRTKLSI